MWVVYRGGVKKLVILVVYGVGCKRVVVNSEIEIYIFVTCIQDGGSCYWRGGGGKLGRFMK